MNTFIRLILLILTACLFGAGIYLGSLNLVGAQSGCFMAGVSVLIFVFLAQFKRFKGPFGIEGEMWEQEMEEAHEITERFRNLADVVAKPLISNSVRMGRWNSGLTRRDVQKMVDGVITFMENSGSTPVEIEVVLEDYRLYTAFDMSRSAFKEVKTILDAKAKEEREPLDAFKGVVKANEHQAHNAATERWRLAEQSAKTSLEAFDISNASNYPELIRKSVNASDLLNEKEKSDLLASIQNTFDDLTYFKDTGKIRRPDVWFNEPEE